MSLRISNTLSLRLGVFLVPLLVVGALAVGYVFDRGRTEALKQRELEKLRLDAERTADDVGHHVSQLKRDILFLAGTPPIHGIRRALEGGGRDATSGSTLEQWRQRLQQIFLAIAGTRPEYFQVRLIGAIDDGRELVRVDRGAEGLRITPLDELQEKAKRCYYRETSALPPGTVYLSRIELNREHGRIAVPHQPTLRAATPIHDPKGAFFGLVVINMDLAQVFQRVQSFLYTTARLSVANERGDFLLHPDLGWGLGFDLGTAFRMPDALFRHADGFTTVRPGLGAFVEYSNGDGDWVAYATARSWDPRVPHRQTVFVLAEPTAQVFQAAGLMRHDSLTAVGILLALTIGVFLVMVHTLTRSLRTLVGAAEGIARGDYRVALPPIRGGEEGTLADAFRRMAEEVSKREQELIELNRSLERHVEQRTRELGRQHALQQLILENIADGVIVADRAGRFVLWNRKAEQITGAGPAEIPWERWASYFGVFRDDTGHLLPTEELPLVRAIRGHATDNLELYLRNPRRSEGRWLQVTGRPLQGENGKIVGGVVVILDVTEQRRLRRRVEEHRGELAKVGQLALTAEIAATAAHELSQPIAAMSNYAGAGIRLQRSGQLDDAELFKILEGIERQSVRAGEVLHKLRALIRRRRQPHCPVDINQVTESCLELFKDRLEQRGIHVERRYAPGLPLLVGDAVELEHLFIQLVANAVEAMKASTSQPPSLFVTTRHDPERGFIVIEIRDTGCGVDTGLADRAFDPWVTDKPDHLGIGLTVAKTIVETLRGQIRVYGAEEGGTVSRVELPLPRQAEA